MKPKRPSVGRDAESLCGFVCRGEFQPHGEDESVYLKRRQARRALHRVQAFLDRMPLALDQPLTSRHVGVVKRIQIYGRGQSNLAVAQPDNEFVMNCDSARNPTNDDNKDDGQSERYARSLRGA